MKRATVVITILLLGAAAPTLAGSLVVNGTFDTDVSHWALSTPSGVLFTWTDLDANGSAASGSGLATSSVTGDTRSVWQCVAAGIAGGTTYDFGAKVRVSSWGAHGTSEVLINWLNGPACTGMYTGAKSYNTALLDTWVSLGGSVTAPPGSVSAQIFLRLYKDGVDGTFQTYLDDVELVGHTAATATQSLFLPAAAAKHGVAPTYWSTNLWVANLLNKEVTISGAFLHGGVDNSALIASPAPLATLPPDGFVALDDLVSTLGVSEETGGVYLLASADGAGLPATLVVATSYTFTPNEQGEGNYGQGIPAVPTGTNDVVRVAGVFQNATYRTNAGALNTSAGTLTLTVTVLDAGGAEVGTATWTLPPYAHTQVSVETLGATSLDGGSVEFARTSSVGSFRAYTSTVDQRTGDAVYNAAQ